MTIINKFKYIFIDFSIKFCTYISYKVEVNDRQHILIKVKSLVS